MPVQNYENLDNNTDVTTTRTLLHEVIPLTGTIVSGTYGTFPNDDNVKNFTHGMFQSVFDYPYLSSSANHIFDITMGYDETSALSGALAAQNDKKINMYNQMSQVLLGYTGSTVDGVRKFESDLTLDGEGTMKEVFFINFSRLLTKDQIKKGSFSMTVGRTTWGSAFDTYTLTVADVSASATGGTTEAIGGYYGLLYVTADAAGSPATSVTDSTAVGNIFYQAGIVVLSASVFHSVGGGTFDGAPMSTFYQENGVDKSTSLSMASSSISGNCDALRHRIQSLSFNNTTEINSKIYFCRVPHNKYNYSSNPTYVSSSKIRVKELATDTPRAYITTVGLYNSRNELLATAKLSEPLMKDPSGELILRVRLDY